MICSPAPTPAESGNLALVIAGRRGEDEAISVDACEHGNRMPQQCQVEVRQRLSLGKHIQILGSSGASVSLAPHCQIGGHPCWPG